MAIPVALSFKSGIKDVSGYAHTTALVGTPTLVAGRFGSALRCFDGNGMTIFYPTGSYYLDTSGGKSFGFWVKASPGPAGQTRVLYDRGNFKVYLATPAGDVGVFVQGSMFSTGIDVCDGQWHHLLYSWNSATGSTPDDMHRWWIDGVKVAEMQRALSYTESANEYAWIGCAVGRTEPANADIGDVRIWNDPVFENEATYLRDLPVTDYQRGLFAFDSTTGGQYRDSSEHGNHLAAGAGSLVAGYHGNALRPTSAWSAPYSPGPMDRITAMFWAKADTLTGLGEILSLYAGGTEKFSLTHTTGGRLRGKCVRDTGSTGTTDFTTTAAPFTAGVWHRVVVQAWASDMRIVVDGVPIQTASGGSTINPINLPSFTGITQIRTGAGVAIDDLRIISNWITAGAINTLPELAIYDTPPSGIFMAGGKPARAWRKEADGSLTELRASGFDSASDTAPPSVPESVSALGSPTATSFVLSWDASVDADEDPDELAPSVPAGLVSSSVGATSFGLDWEESSDA